jgi:hypothetical protein
LLPQKFLDYATRNAYIVKYRIAGGAEIEHCPADVGGNSAVPLLRGGHAKSRRPNDISSLDDGVSDHPVWTLNFLALANALAGYVYLPGETPTAQDSDLIYPGSAGDTDYYVIDSGIVPILRPLASLGVPHFLLSAPEAAEPDAPQVDSPCKAAPSAEPVAAEASAGTRKSNDAKTVSAQTDTTPTSVPEPKVRPTAAGTKPKPPAKQPDRPKVRGPIEFDL